MQVDELRDAVADYEAARKEAVTQEETTSGSGVRTVFRRADSKKLAASRTEFERRVDNTLNTEQKKAWNDKGYSSAFGAGHGPRMVFASRVSDDARLSTEIEIDAGDEATEE